jgi:trk system potassium uptake protein TrkH
MRTDVDLRERYRSIVSFTGLILALCGLILLSPLLALPWWPIERQHAHGFLFPGLGLAAVGFGLWRFLIPRRGPVLTVQDGGVIVLLSWLIVTVASALTFVMVIRLSFTQALFESVSAWTTTGLSVVDVEKAPRVILLWRSIMQLAGGAGMAIILVTLAGGPLGPGLAVAEGRSDQLVPHVRRSARLVLTIYAGYALAGMIALHLAGMSWFDAVNHSFCAVSTGGFSTRAASVGYWDSAAVEAVTLPLMVLGSTNFQVAYLVLRGRFRPALRNAEVRTAAVLAAVMIPLMLVFVTSAVYGGVGKQLRVAVFEVVSALTTTGYSTTTYSGWPAMGMLILIVLMIIGGGTGSTAGAMKQHRAHLLARAVFWEIRRLWLPARAVTDASVWRGDGKVSIVDRDVVQVAVFAVAYLSIFVLGAGVLVACGFGLQESLFEYASALGTVGLSVGVTSASAPAPVLWAEIVGMLLGRLEIFIVLIALRKLFADGAGMLRRVRR